MRNAFGQDNAAGVGTQVTVVPSQFHSVGGSEGRARKDELDHARRPQSGPVLPGVIPRTRKGAVSSSASKLVSK